MHNERERPQCLSAIGGGWKSTMLDGHLRTQLGAFFNRYDNFQFGVTDLTSGNVGVVNLPSATIKGFEGQVQAQIDSWALDAGVAYVDSFLKGGVPFVNTRLIPSGTLGPQCPAGTASEPPICFDYGPSLQNSTGGPNLYSPKWSFNAGVEYRIPLPNDMSLTPRINYAYLGSQYTSLSYSPVTDYLPSRGLISALITLRLPQAWSVEAYGTNLANKVYVSGQYVNEEFFGAPRQFGVRVHKTF